MYQFESSSTKRIYSISSQNLNWASKNVQYLFRCKTCHKQYTGTTEEFRKGLMRCAHSNFLRKKKLNKSLKMFIRAYDLKMNKVTRSFTIYQNEFIYSNKYTMFWWLSNQHHQVKAKYVKAFLFLCKIFVLI